MLETTKASSNQQSIVEKLRAEVKRIIFPSEESPPVVMSSNLDNFKLMMSTFHDYEKAVSKLSYVLESITIIFLYLDWEREW